MALIRILNTPLTTGKETSYLTLAPAAGDTTITVKDIGTFVSAQNKFVLIGTFGNETSEVKKISSISGTTITLTAVLTYSHSIDDLVTQLDFDQVEFHRVATATAPTGGDASTLTASGLEADKLYTSYNDSTNSTGYGYAFYKNSGSGTYSSVSMAIPYTGVALNSVRKMKDQALAITRENITDLISEDFLLDELNNFQQDVTRTKDWSWEFESATDTLVSGAQSYSLPTSPYAFKYTDSSRAFLSVHIHNYDRLDYIDKSEYDRFMVDTTSTTLASSVAVIDTTISLTDAGDFGDSGTVTVGDGSDDEITYTGKTGNTLTGVTGISAIHSSGATVWQTSSLGMPSQYTVWNDSIYFQPVASSTYHGYTIHYDYYKAIPALVNDTETTIIPFYHIAQYYLAWKIEDRKGNTKDSDRWRQIYESRLAGEMKRENPRQYFRFIPNVGRIRPRH